MKLSPAVGIAVFACTLCNSARAIPAFARKFNLPCSTCHIAPPYLNPTGRAFLEAGYRLPDEDGNVDEAMQHHQVINDNLVLEKMLPWAARVRSVAIDKQTDSAAQIQPLAELEFSTMGNFYRTGSFHLAAGGEFDEGFAFGGDGFIGIHPSRWFNVVGGFGSAMSADPYNTFRTEDHGLTVKTKAAFTEGHQSAVAVVDDASFVTAYGRAGILFYSGGIALTPGELDPEHPGVVMARVAVDAVDGLTIGAFGLGGRRAAAADGEGPAEDASLWRAGADLNATLFDVTANVVFVVSGDQLEGSAHEITFGGFVEALYAWRLDGRPALLPVARLDWVQRDGDNVLGGVVDLSSYVFENARVGAELSYEQVLTTSDDAGVGRGSVFLDLVF